MDMLPLLRRPMPAIAPLSFALLAATLTPSARAQHIDVGRVDRIVRAEVDSGFSGVVLVATRDSIVLRRAYGRVEKAEESFWIASITKSFTAAAILALQHEHRLSVHDSIGRFIANVPADKRAITIHQLLTHTAGFRAASTGDGINDRETFVRAVLATPLAYAPGKGYEYGNDDYGLLAAIIEVISRKTWADFVKERVIVPAGLAHTGFGAGTADWGHRGSNGMRSTTDDLARWARVLASGKIGTLPVEDIERPQIFVRTSADARVYYGYGARVLTRAGRTIEVVHSGSGDDGNTSMVRRLASGEMIVVLSDAGFHGNGTWAGYLGGLIGPDTDGR